MVMLVMENSQRLHFTAKVIEPVSRTIQRRTTTWGFQQQDPENNFGKSGK
jgi:hypothetical protein